jgi:hypothetical protein
MNSPGPNGSEGRPSLGSGSPAAIGALRAMNSPGPNGSEGRLSEPTGRNAYSGDPKRSEGPPPLRPVLKISSVRRKCIKPSSLSSCFLFCRGVFLSALCASAVGSFEAYGYIFVSRKRRLRIFCQICIFWFGNAYLKGLARNGAHRSTSCDTVTHVPVRTPWKP